jgi:hypothetical protein
VLLFRYSAAWFFVVQLRGWFAVCSSVLVLLCLRFQLVVVGVTFDFGFLVPLVVGLCVLLLFLYSCTCSFCVLLLATVVSLYLLFCPPW